MFYTHDTTVQFCVPLPWEYSTSASAVGFQPKEGSSTLPIPTILYKEYIMKSKIKVKVLSVIENKRIIKDFDDWLNDTEAMQQLREMNAGVVVAITREVWEEIKSKN